MKIRPYKTLLFDQGQAMPGMVISAGKFLSSVLWYKYGYDHPDNYTTYHTADDILQHQVTESLAFFRTHGLPPGYRSEIAKRDEIEKQLRILASRIQSSADDVCDFEETFRDLAEFFWEHVDAD